MESSQPQPNPFEAHQRAVQDIAMLNMGEPHVEVQYPVQPVGPNKFEPGFSTEGILLGDEAARRIGVDAFGKSLDFNQQLLVQGESSGMPVHFIVRREMGAPNDEGEDAKVAMVVSPHVNTWVGVAVESMQISNDGTLALSVPNEVEMPFDTKGIKINQMVLVPDVTEKIQVGRLAKLLGRSSSLSQKIILS